MEKIKLYNRLNEDNNIVENKINIPISQDISAILGNEKKILESQTHPLKKIIYNESWNAYYSVSFLDYNDNSINICSSSQIWCVESCSFCATWDKKFIKNLTIEQLVNEFIDWLNCFDNINWNKIETAYIIMEWMWEASHNIKNVFNALLKVHPYIKDKYKRFVFRISTVWNIKLVDDYINFIEKNKEILKNIEFQFQISLHNPLNEERIKLIPKLSLKYSIEEILKNFYKLSDYLNTKLKCNYLLLNYPEWGNNYSEKHLEKLVSILDSQKTRIKLTKYSDTWKWFSSPDDTVYKNVKKYLEWNWINTQIRELYWDDLEAACWMLDY